MPEGNSLGPSTSKRERLGLYGARRELSFLGRIVRPSTSGGANEHR